MTRFVAKKMTASLFPEAPAPEPKSSKARRVAEHLHKKLVLEPRGIVLPPTGMKLLALDLATKTGWVIRSGNSIDSGVWNLKGDKFEGGGMRFLRFRRYLSEALDTGVTRVAYEAVRRHMGVDAAHIYGALMGIVQEECERRSPKIPYEGVTVQAVKQKATGKGNAKKDAMLEAAKKQWPAINIIDDNHADALWIAEVVISRG